jgi:hypothetical protein
MFKKNLSQTITSPPDTIQFAKDRKFEESWIIPRSEIRPNDDKVEAYINKEPFELLIVEFIWNSADDNNRFVLTVFLDKKCILQDHKKFIFLCLDIFYHDSVFTDLIEFIDKHIIGKPYLFLHPVESVNISIFNHWLSVGPVELWKKGELYDKQVVDNKIQARPDIEKTTLNYQGLFFRFNVNGNYDGPYFGLKTPCCRKEGSYWVVDYKKIEYWMKVMLNN